ncbi:12673_t:CDS:2 [Entrophospora sp. SA101]|nr:12673_t:CDS:2 [Entrophospora sp. SA101]
MPVPFEAIIPLGIIIGMFGVTGTLINLSRRYQHDWKSNPTAPPSFSTNSVWYLKQLVQTFYPEHQTHELLLSHSLQQQVSETTSSTTNSLMRLKETMETYHSQPYHVMPSRDSLYSLGSSTTSG